MPPQNPEVCRSDVETLRVQIEAIDEKFTLLFAERERRAEALSQAQREALQNAKEAVAAAMAHAKEAVNKAESAQDRRYDALNELRGAMTDQAANFITRDKFDGLVEKVAALERIVTGITSRGDGRGDIWGILTAGIATLISLATLAVLLMRH